MLQTFDERNADLKIWINGELHHRDEAGISPFDSAVQGGDAVWEGLRVYEGRIFKLQEHLDRLRSSAKALAFADYPDDDVIVAAIEETLEVNEMTDSVHIRLTVSRGVKVTSGMDPRLNTQGHTLIVLAEHKPPVYGCEAITLITSSIRRFPPDCLDPKIHHANLLQSILAKIEANNAGADDALMLDRDGFVAETNATHLFLVVGGEVVTSPCDACPEGITRATVLELCRAHGVAHTIRRYSVMEAYRADEVFVTGTMGELVPVREIDGRSIDGPHPGPMTACLTDHFHALIAHEGVCVT